MAFNMLPTREKWETWKTQKGEWHCKSCNEVLTDGPQSPPPFHGAGVHCGNCDAELTRRTGGGQLNPFRWELFSL
jgi:hypothetical protein